MNHEEAKFLLRARRPGGADDGDPRLREALAETVRDPKLAAWLQREERFDVEVARKLAQIAPPPELKEAILAGARASAVGAKASFWRLPIWLAAAAVVAVLLSVAPRVGRGQADLDELAGFARRDLAGAHNEHVGDPRALAAVKAQLAGAGSLREVAHIDVDELRRQRCRAVRLGGREVFEICFRRDGAWFHLYVTPGGGRGDGALREWTDDPRLAVAAWSDSRNSYALLTSAGREALRRAL
jgi:hypothetical protein